MKKRSKLSEAAVDVTKCYARLSFWVPPDRLGEFEAKYQERLVPVLKNHGLAKSSPCERPAVEGIFSRLFEVGKPSEVVEVWRSFWNDPAWREVLQDVGMSLGIKEPDDLIPCRFEPYSIPAGSGEKVPAGDGIGYWCTFDVPDGLAGVKVNALLQDREGNLWVGCGGGVSHFDGETFVSNT